MLQPTVLTPSGLSANAPAFSPAPPPPDASTSDYFAQTGAAEDDLFNDLTPAAVDNSMRVRSEDDLFSDDFTPVQKPVVSQTPPRTPRGRGDAPRRPARARGRGGRPGGNDSVQRQPAQQNGETEAQEPASAPESAPTGPKKEVAPSVRGDRQATGGVRKPKLSEAELAQKMAAIQIKNASLTAAHARAEADAASFAQREEEAKQAARQQKEVAQKREKEERRDRQQMMGERERNRQRKLKAMEGREWDAEKNEEDFGRGGKFDKKGAFAGDSEEYTDGREYIYREPRGGQRGGRGRGRGGGGGEQALPKQDEFPALPAAAKESKIEQAAKDGVASASVKSWADQVESSNPS